MNEGWGTTQLEGPGTAGARGQGAVVDAPEGKSAGLEAEATDRVRT